MIRFDGQVAVVTGAGRGLGRAHARLLAELGAHVVVHDAGLERDGSGGDPELATRAAEEIGGVPCAEDLSTRAGCERTIAFALERFERLDVLVHNAGLVDYTGIEGTTPESWERLLAVNVAAPFWLARAAFPEMRRARYGRIVLTVSGVALSLEHALTDVTAYAVGKAAQFGLMNALAKEGEEAGIRVNAISPAAATRMYRRPVAEGELTPEQVAPAVAFLASSACDVTGVVVRAADGWFGVGRYALGEGVEFGREPVSPDVIAERWRDIAGDRG